MSRNIVNAEHLADKIRLRIAEVEQPEVVAWFMGRFRKAILTYGTTQMVVHPDSVRSFESYANLFGKQLEAVLSREAPAIFRESSLFEYLDSSSHGGQAMSVRPQRATLGRYLRAFIENNTVDFQFKPIPEEYLEPWVQKETVYDLLDIDSELKRIGDLIDVLTSDWFAPRLPSLSHLKVQEVVDLHESWVDWLAKNAALEEDSKSLILVTELEAGDGRMFKLFELTSKVNFEFEGEALRHCLGERFDLASKKGYRVFSLRNDDGSILTLEYDPSKNAFLQIRGFRNRDATLGEINLLRPFIAQLGAIFIGIDVTDSEKIAPAPVEPKRRGRAVPVRRIADVRNDDWDEEDEDEDEDEDDDGEAEARPRNRRRIA